MKYFVHLFTVQINKVNDFLIILTNTKRALNKIDKNRRTKTKCQRNKKRKREIINENLN